MKMARVPLSVSILSTLACLLILTWILLSLISFKTAEKDLIAQKNDEARLLLAAFVEIIPASLQGVREDSLITAFASRLGREKDFAGLTVIDATGKAVYVMADRKGGYEQLLATVQSGRESFGFSHDRSAISRYAPIHSGKTVIGAARLTFSLGGAQQRLQGSRTLFLAYFILDFLLLLGIGSFMLSHIVLVPIRKVLAATNRIAAGDYGQRIHVRGGAEIADLSQSFNQMAEGLEKKRIEVEQYVESLEQANIQLQAAREETIRSEKMASVGLLAAGMAHEIGTPLAAIIGYTGILRDELRDDVEKADYLRRIDAESTRIDRIVRGLLDYARPTEIQCVRTDVSRLMGETLELLNAQGVLKQVRTTMTLETLLPAVFVDPHQLQQVFINLLINARDALPAGGELTVTTCRCDQHLPMEAPASATSVRGRRKEDFHGAFSHAYTRSKSVSHWVTVVVRDSGEGIPAENLNRIFDPFFTTKPPGKGTGLGLAICARIIDSFGGRIMAESELGKGTTITVMLPVTGQEQEA